MQKSWTNIAAVSRYISTEPHNVSSSVIIFWEVVTPILPYILPVWLEVLDDVPLSEVVSATVLSFLKELLLAKVPSLVLLPVLDVESVLALTVLSVLWLGEYVSELKAEVLASSEDVC